MSKKAGWLLSLLIIVGLLVACTISSTPDTAGQIGSGMRMGEGMMQRHMASIPAEYARLTNPVMADADSLARGEAIYQAHCAVCHGEEGQGDGPAVANLDPPPAPVVHTGKMLSDAYLFYRISGGGTFAPFNSAMPAFADTLSERERWDVINYIRSLNNGMMDGGMMNCMMGFGMTGGMMALGLLLLIGLIVAVVLIVVWTVRRTGESSQPAESPQEILKRRYARGEIDSEQYERMKRQLNEG